MGKFNKDILEHDKDKDSHLCIQYAAFDHQDGGDDLMTADKEGHCVMSELTYTSMRKEPEVIVLIAPHTSKETALKLIEKIKERFKEDGDWGFELEIEFNMRVAQAQYEMMENDLHELLSNHEYTWENLEYLLGTIKIIRDKNELDMLRKKDELDKQRKKDELYKRLDKDDLDIPF